ncbi:hypothetical protein OG986_19660 [Streptomyces cellulosae]|uniref:hypothetical protein n=1 Tax=Streptomyces sp. Akac8 TaxID=2563106 RepID=UPI00109E455D|nr:hypothetical protein E7X38_12335 [Streptomyces sp. Akac8]
MIVPSELLGDLLEQIDQKRAAHLALDFARHVLDLERDEIEEPVWAACLEYVEACHEAIDLGEVPPRLSEAKEQLWEAAARWDTDRHVLARGAGLVLDAARVGTEQMLAKAAGHGPSTPIPCLHVARRLQAEAGQWAAQHRPAGADERTVARRARWEEARWQVRYVIASEPNPHGDA